MSAGRRLQLDRDHLIQMADAADFYTAVPVFQYLQEAAIETRRALKKQKGCSKCYHEWQAMRGICDAIFMKLRELKDANDPAIDAIKNWLSQRKGYRVERCVLYYRRSRAQGAIARFEF